MNNSPEQLMQRLLDLYSVIATLDTLAAGLRNTEFASFAEVLARCTRLLRKEWDALMEGILAHVPPPPQSGGIQ